VETEPVVVILNPVAGSGKALTLLPKVISAIESLGRQYHIHLTVRAGDGRVATERLARQGASVIIAVGGDGTIHEVANGLCDSGTRVPMGVVPAGNGGDFARTIGASKRIEESVPLACSGNARPIDVGVATFDDGSSHVFINVAGLGFDALAAERAARTKFLPGANLPYLVAALQTLVSYKNIPVTVEADGEVITTNAVFVQAANAQFMGGGYKIAPMADISDGLLDVAIVGDMTKPDLLRTLPKVYSGGHVNHPKFIHRQARSIRIDSERPSRVQLDGEVMGSAPVTFSVKPGAIMLAG